tara:strand:- start:21965 stop:22828 length:864 start_codon:yes stop_codon:yes gene_type:complete
MILHFRDGQLGNQLFQYTGLKKYFPNEKLIFLGCESIHQSFDNLEAHFISLRKIKDWNLFNILHYVALLLIQIRILGVITENKDTNSTEYKIIARKGLFWWVFVTYKIHFQHHDFLEQIDNFPVVKPQLLKKAEDWLEGKGVNLKKDSVVFVHIRRGDYLLWPSLTISVPAVLSLDWYKRAMSLMENKIQSPVFVLMSDDLYYLRDIFTESDKVIISNNKPIIDLSIMSLSYSGIMSASSFAWWGASLARNKIKENNHFIAPKYWGGHRIKKWYPKNFRTKWITYFE